MVDRLGTLKAILWAFVGVLSTVTVVRFLNGLGAVTNLSDATPWGLWIAFDVMSGVALAAGGFVVAATVYIFGLERYRPFVRPAILTAFLGYIAVAVGLLYDLGLPWNIWHPAIYWQYHSVLFEVGACVMCYLTVLTLEFAPVVLEHRWFDRPLFRRMHSMLKTMTIPLVIAGIVLSTLHQSSLGSLFLITPYRLHPLWYSPIIYVLFFVSAVGLGLMMVVLESLLSAYFFGHKLKTDLLAGFGKAALVVLGIYVLLRVGDLGVRGVLGSAMDGSWQSVLFIGEMAVSAVIPVGLLAFHRVRTSVAGLATCSSMTVAGMVLNRLDVCIIAFKRPEDMGYFPSWMEFAVSLGIVSAALLVFVFFVERLKVYDHEPLRPAAEDRPSSDPLTVRTLLPRRLAIPQRSSLVAIAAAAVAVAFLPRDAVTGAPLKHTPVAASRTLDGVAVERGAKERRALRLAANDADGLSSRELVPLMLIDGNRNGDLVLFDHEEHERRLNGDDSCAECHHLNMPLDENSSCVECHRDMYDPTPVFDHESHVRQLDGNAGCVKCHDDASVVKTYETSTACVECHDDLAVESSIIDPPQDRWRDAASYMDAMHGLCEKCHVQRVDLEPERHPRALDRCDTCHNIDRAGDLRRLAPDRPSARRRRET
jgi:Ni/Fe-hydrogenase subunit HybB-like protein